MIGSRRMVRLLLALAGLLLSRPPDAWAAAEVHRFSLVFSSNPSQIAATDFNDYIGFYNRTRLDPRGLEGVSKIGFGWYHQGELRYFLRPNVALSAGVGQLRSISRREFLPRISQRIELRAEVNSVPVHLGADYYLAPFNAGDFQARAYLGGGLMSLTGNKVVFEQLEFATDTATTLGGSYRVKGKRESPGYYVQAGAHMFFAVRYSVMLGVMYRSAQIRDMEVVYESVDTERHVSTPVPGAEPRLSLDMSGVSMRMALGIGF